ncbi:zinc ribbon domain-containing protein [Ectothiorhodospiraceae bacterium WFHF3C12]|nr:zinc ribbon domain-containing protein [Ectothiorhodospiraceae bacterium WFHF3C12]
MALIHCGECDKKISDMAEACPKCGAPVPGSAPAATRQDRKTSTVMRAGAKWEAGGFVLIVVGMILAMAADGPAGSAGGWMAFAGILAFLAGRFM